MIKGAIEQIAVLIGRKLTRDEKQAIRDYIGASIGRSQCLGVQDIILTLGLLKPPVVRVIEAVLMRQLTMQELIDTQEVINNRSIYTAGEIIKELRL